MRFMKLTSPSILLVLAITWLGLSSAFAQRGAGRRAGDWRTADTVSVGSLAPDFNLPTKDATREIKLSSFLRKKPVVLVFGSYT